MIFNYEISNLVKYSFSYVQTHFQTYVKAMISDDDPEFTLKTFYMTHEIHNQTPCSHGKKIPIMLCN